MHFDTVFIIYCRGIFINLRRPISEHHWCQVWGRSERSWFYEIPLSSISSKRHFILMVNDDKNPIGLKIGDAACRPSLGVSFVLQKVNQFVSVKHELVSDLFHVRPRTLSAFEPLISISSSSFRCLHALCKSRESVFHLTSYLQFTLFILLSETVWVPFPHLLPCNEIINSHSFSTMT